MNLMFKALTGVLLSMVLLTASAVAGEYLPNPDIAGIGPAPLLDIRNAKRVFPGIVSGGQPTNQQLIEAQAKGFKTVINLRSAGEMQGSGEADLVRRLGMNYITIPVAGASAINLKNSQQLINVLADVSQYPVLVHCASGNRVGALFALDAALRMNLSVEEAIAVGKQAGMTRLESVVRVKIEQQ